MTSTELKIGLTNSARPSSRVLKPPGGDHSNIFAEPEVNINPPRPKYNQQNSSNLNACMGSDDPNKMVQKIREDIAQAKTSSQDDQKKEQKEVNAQQTKDSNMNGGSNDNQNKRTRVPPGGFSSGGFW